MSKAALLKIIVRAFLLLTALLVLATGLLYINQDKLIYNATTINPAVASSPPNGITALDYMADIDGKQLRQVSFYVRPPVKASDPRVILIFHGKKDLASNWFDFAKELSESHPSSYILLMEYPGYGLSKGKPNPKSILTANRSALLELADKEKLEIEELDRSAKVIGHSLGTAIALNYSAAHPPQKIILSAPFTSTLDMAKKMVGPALANLLTHRYDNLGNLKKITRQTKTEVTILHGDRDNVIPVQMGRKLAKVSKDIQYFEIKGADHGGILQSPEYRRAVGMPPPR